MHVAATVGTSMRNPKAPHADTFEWLNDLTDVISKANNFINFGQSWHIFNQVRSIKRHFYYNVMHVLHFKIWQAHHERGDYAFRLKYPKFNNDTRFENYIYLQYVEFWEKYPLLIEVFEETKEDLREGNSSEKKKAETADQVQGKMYNVKFALSLSGMCDVYKHYSTGIKIVQVRNYYNLIFSWVDCEAQL